MTGAPTRVRDTGREMSAGSTTRDLVEVVTGLFEAADRWDWEAVLRPYARDAILETEDGFLDLAGASGLRGFWEEWAAMFEDWTVKAETVVDLGNGVVYAVFQQEGVRRQAPASSQKGGSSSTNG